MIKRGEVIAVGQTILETFIINLCHFCSFSKWFSPEIPHYFRTECPSSIRYALKII